MHVFRLSLSRLPCCYCCCSCVVGSCLSSFTGVLAAWFGAETDAGVPCIADMRLLLLQLRTEKHHFLPKGCYLIEGGSFLLQLRDRSLDCRCKGEESSIVLAQLLADVLMRGVFLGSPARAQRLPGGRFSRVRVGRNTRCHRIRQHHACQVHGVCIAQDRHVVFRNAEELVHGVRSLAAGDEELDPLRLPQWSPAGRCNT
jgi:hypothetical protein